MSIAGQLDVKTIKGTSDGDIFYDFVHTLPYHSIADHHHMHCNAWARKVVHKSSPAAATIRYDHCFQQTSEFLNIYLHAWDGHKTWYRTLLPSYLLH